MYENAMAHQVHFVFLLCSLIPAASSEVYQIATSSTSAELCTASCLTLSKFATHLNRYLHSNTTLMFLPGTHYLTINMSVWNMTNFSMISESITVQVVCRNYSHISFSHSQYISLSNLEFIGCGGNQVEHVEEFIVKDTKFDGQNTSSTVLEITGTVAQIFDSTFTFNKRGKFKNFTDTLRTGEKYCISVHHFVGGVITATLDSKININRSTFENNGAQYGGVIFAQHSIIVMHNSSFSNNSGKNGGVVFSLRSNIIIVASKFEDNGVTPENSSLIEGGGVLFSAICNITIKASKFNDNAATSNSNSTKHSVGGGVLQSFESTIIIETSIFDGNTAISRGILSGGGVLYSVLCSITVEASEFENNAAITREDTSGGGVLASYKSNITIKESKFNDNTATSGGYVSGGGVLYSHKCNIAIETSEFNDNTANSTGYRSGGGVLFTYSRCTITVETSKFDNNTSITWGEDSGGGVLFNPYWDDNIIINKSKFDGNSVISGGHGSGGGVLFCKLCTVTMEISEFNGNTATTRGYGSGGGVLNSYDSKITIKMCKFDGNIATSIESDGNGGTLFFIGGDITIDMSEFYGNMIITRRIGEDVASLYSSVAMKERNAAKNGGVLYSMGCSIAIISSRFYNNSATSGGVLHCLTSTITIKGITATQERAGDGSSSTKGAATGSVEFRNNGHHLRQSSSTIHTFQEGGAITLRYSEIYFNGNCSFQHNHAVDGGGLMSVESKLYVYGNLTIAHNTVTGNGGGVYLLNSELNCQKKCNLLLDSNHAEDKGGGLHAISSTIKVISAFSYIGAKLKFIKNVAEKGGGLSLEVNAKLYLNVIPEHDLSQDNLQNVYYSWNTSLLFIANTAHKYGGAIYVDDVSNSHTCASSSNKECFLQIVDVTKLQLPYKITQSIIPVYFAQNKANISGSTLYGGLLDRCTMNHITEVIINETANTSILSSDPVKVCLCTDYKYNNIISCSHQLHIEVKKGEAFNVSVVAIDQVEHPVDAIIHATLTFSHGGLSEGQMTNEIQGECTNLTFNVVSPHKKEILILYALDGPCKDADLSRRVVKIEFLPCSCPLGLQLSGKTEINCSCNCHDNIRGYIEHCDSQTGSFIRKSRLRTWISYINDTNIIGYLVYQNCPFDYCNSLSLPVDLNKPNGADTQCAFNRSSLLCGSCQRGLSLSLSSSQCLQCPSYWPALLIAITIVAILAGIALVAFLLFINMTVAVGTLNGLIFYANIVHANKSILLPFKETNNFIMVYISLLNLELGVDTCYFPQMDNYARTWLQLAFPAFVFYLVILIILLSSYSIRFSKLIGNKDPVATLATLILFSYAKLLQICFESLSVGILTYPDGSTKTVWLPDATIPYFQGKHVPLFIAAIIILLIGLFYTTILFLWQWRFYLPRWKLFALYLRNQKFQFFIETYHAPFTPKYRYWTGLLLIIRAVLYLVAAANISNDPKISLSAIVFTMNVVVILMAFSNLRMYKKMPVNILESFFVLNLLLFSVFTWFSLSGTKISQKIVAYTSVLSTFIILVFIIFYHVYNCTRAKNFNLSRIINIFRADPRIRAGCHLRPQSEDNVQRLLGMVIGPANNSDYNVPLLNRQIVEPTCSEIELSMSSQGPDQSEPEEANIYNVPDPCDPSTNIIQ